MSLFDDDPGIDAGRNAVVEADGVRYFVQTQCSLRDVPVIESLVFRGGEVLVRVTASWGDVARRCGFTNEDGRHLLDAQPVVREQAEDGDADHHHRREDRVVDRDARDPHGVFPRLRARPGS